MKKNKSILLSTPYLIWMVVFTLIPLGVVCYYALTDPSTGEFSLVNLRGLNLYWGVLWQSIFYAVASAFICLLLGYPMAYYIAHRSQTAQKFLYMLVMLPMCMSFLPYPRMGRIAAGHRHHQQYSRRHRHRPTAAHPYPRGGHSGHGV